MRKVAVIVWAMAGGVWLSNAAGAVLGANAGLAVLSTIVVFISVGVAVLHSKGAAS